MPTKTKEINEENNKKNTTKKDTATKKKATTKSASTATKKVAVKKSTVEKDAVATKKTTTTKKVEPVSKKATTTKKVATKKATTSKKTSTQKKSTVSKKVATSKKSTTAKKTTAKKETTSRKKSTYLAKEKTTRKAKPLVEVVEYYDLPYRYNETIVKILYQTPDTLFVYWDIADSDRENYIKQYGENFFNITRPVLIIHNDTMNYSFEIPINDFANSWYLHINDSKCNYRVELGRRPNYYNHEVVKEIQEKIKTDYIYVSSSNEIESPNDHVLFNTNENNTVRFRNVKNHQEKSISLYDIIKRLPALKRVQNIPYISEELLKSLYSGIYENEDISLFEKLTNPSSAGNPSSGSMSSRFI